MNASHKVRGIKSVQQKLRQEGMPAGRAAKIAASMVTGVKKKQKQKGNKGEGVLFSGDGNSTKPVGTTAGGRVYTGGARSTKVVPPKTSASAIKVKSGGKGGHSFKSKSRFKRR